MPGGMMTETLKTPTMMQDSSQSVVYVNVHRHRTLYDSTHNSILEG